MQEAKHNLREIAHIDLLSRLDGIEPGTIDTVFCLEVFEHLPAKETANALADIAHVLSDDGVLIVGVPIEIGLPALYKGVFRVARRYGAFDATLKNVMACVVGRPPLKRPLAEMEDGKFYTAYHVGFDHRRLRSILMDSFEITTVLGAPFPVFGTGLNPEVYFLLRKFIS
jgi:SAM-dependent methyltransferase